MACPTNLITVNRLMFSCWLLFNAEAAFSFFEISFDLLVKVRAVFRIVRSAGASCTCFCFFISSCCSFIFRSYLSLILMFEFDNFLDGLFSCLLHLLVGLSERSFSCMFGLFLWSVLLVFLGPLVGVLFACNISA